MSDAETREQPEKPKLADRSRQFAYLLTAFVLVYNAVMAFVSCFYHTSIMDPWLFLWGFLYSIGGPAIVIAAVVRVVWLSVGRRLTPLRALLPVVAVLSVVVWWQGFWSIGEHFRPKLFDLVAESNERRAMDAIKNMEDPNRVIVRNFRYPYCRMFAWGRYEDGALFLVVPSAPGPKDTILFDPNDVVPKEGWDHLSGPWYYRYALE
jgi:hypothetical protein